jgi:hypothetical protein
MILLIIYKNAYFNINDLDPVIPSVVVSLLQEFNSVFPEETPSEIPSLWGIKHQIDLVLEASVPNRLAYRSNPRRRRSFKGK